MTTVGPYYVGQELPYMEVVFDTNGETVDMSTGWTFTGDIASTADPDTSLVSFDSAIIGDSGVDRHAYVAWPISGALNTLAASVVAPQSSFRVQVTAIRGSDSRNFTMQGTLLMRPAIP